MRNDLADNATDAAERINQNVRNLPLTSVALAGLLGAGVLALVSSLKRNRI